MMQTSPIDWEADRLREACGLFGVYSPSGDVAKSIYYGLYALQHRGQESAGITTSTGDQLLSHKAMGLVPQVFSETILGELTGSMGIGHTRYSTTGSSTVGNAQPLVMPFQGKEMAIAHNGNLVNTKDLVEELTHSGYKFATTTDSEIFGALMARSQAASIEEALIQALQAVRGAFCLLVLTPDKLIGVRDTIGLRPLCLGRLNDTYYLASESCAFDIVGATFLRDLEPGEMVVIDRQGVRSQFWTQETRRAMCVFEFIYFARPDTRIYGKNLYEARVRMGVRLAEEHPVKAEVVIGVPDSGAPAALGYANTLNIPLTQGLVKNRYVGRTFIQPEQQMRDMGVRVKLNPIREVIEGREIVLVDDSIVRGTTSRQIVKILREAGARKIHMRISSPPIIDPCFYGINTATKAELIAANYDVKGVEQYLGVDSLSYLSIRGMLDAIGFPEKTFCLACLNGEYPIPIPESLKGLKLIFA